MSVVSIATDIFISTPCFYAFTCVSLSAMGCAFARPINGRAGNNKQPDVTMAAATEYKPAAKAIKGPPPIWPMESTCDDSESTVARVFESSF